MNPETAHTPAEGGPYYALVACVAIVTLGFIRVTGIHHGLDSALSFLVDSIIAAIAGVSTTRLMFTRRR